MVPPFVVRGTQGAAETEVLGRFEENKAGEKDAAPKTIRSLVFRQQHGSDLSAAGGVALWGIRRSLSNRWAPP